MRSPLTASLAVLSLLSFTSSSSISPFEHNLPRLSKFVSHYQPLTYDTLQITSIGHRTRRSTDGSTQSLDFDAYGRKFKLRIKRDSDYVFSDDLQVISSDGSNVDLNLDHIYSGQLEDVPNSHVYGQVTDGVFEGQIRSPKETYYLERSFRYRNESSSPSFHSIIYPSSAVSHPILSKQLGSGCAFNIDPKITAWMDSIAQSAVPGSEDETPSIMSKRNNGTIHSVSKRSPQNIYPRVHPGFSQSSRDHPKDENMWSRNAQSRISNDRKDFHYPHPHVASPPYGPSTVKKRTCSLYIQTDTYLWEHIRKDAMTDGKAREEIASLVSQHIKAVNHIYENSDFNGIRGLKFIVQRLRINDSSSCDSQVKRDHNPFCSPNIDVSNFLNLNSQFNHNDFCLAYIFTYRDFTGGTLGLAWVASTSGASGGICEKYKSYTENVHGRQVQTKRSLNTGIITFVNYNSRVPPKVSELTLAHEIGHNFGSPHDYPADCRPGGTQGNFIMYSSATSGERPNNNKFSPCSMRNISAVLQAVFNTEGKENCFQEDNGPFCGNKIVEENEECDCGYDQKECTESCCYPHDIEPYLDMDPSAKPCTRRRAIINAVCSPSEGPCCSDKCKYEPSHKLCRHDTECTHQSSCNGFKAICPPGDPKSDKTECNGGTQVCWNGSCVGSICQKYGMEECFLTSRSGANPDEMCEVACQRANDVHTCQRTSKLPEMRNISGLKLRPGSPCNDFQGYCDVFQRCRAVDAEGPLAMLKNLLFNQYTLSTIKQWAMTYWWVCMLMAVAVMVFMAAFIKCCAVHTPSSNPKRKKALRISDTLRRPADTLRRKRHRPGTRPHHSQVPSNAAIPLQPSAPLPQDTVTASSQYSSQSQGGNNYQVHHQQSTSFNALQMQQNQLVVTLPPEQQRNSNVAPVNPVGNTFLLEPPPPYPGPVNNSTHIQHSSRSSGNRSIGHTNNPITNASAVIAGPSHGYGEGRGHYNRRSGQSQPFPPAPISSAPSKSVPLAMPSSSKSSKSLLR